MGNVMQRGTTKHPTTEQRLTPGILQVAKALFCMTFHSLHPASRVSLIVFFCHTVERGLHWERWDS
jgi:hypothetical protein